jgi:sugar phosphate isomerase/epimerase
VLGWGTLSQASPDELVDAAAEHGFHSITVNPAACLRWCASGGDLEVLQVRAERAGLRVAAVDALINGLPGAPAAAVVPPEFRDAFRHDEAECRRIITATRAKRLNVAHFLGQPTPLPKLADAIRALCQRLAPDGCSVSLEFIPGTGIPDLATAEQLRRMVGEPNVGLLLDTWHFARAAGTPGDILVLPRNAIIALQLSDRVESPDDAVYRPMSGRLLPGEGTLPLAAVLAAARQNNPDLDIEIEVFSAELRSLAPRVAARLVASSLRAWVDSLDQALWALSS